MSYLKEYVRITLTSIKSPEKFFRELEGEGKEYLKPLAYLLISLSVYTLGSSLAFLFQSSGLRIAQYLWFVFPLYLRFGIPFPVLMYLSTRLLGGKGSFGDTFRVICYSLSTLNIAWIFFVFAALAPVLGRFKGMLVAGLLIVFMLLWLNSFQYSLCILTAGLSATSGIRKLRALTSVFIAIVATTVVSSLIISGVNYLEESLNYRSVTIKQTPDEIRSYNLTAYLGSAPVTDGIISDDDRWTEGTNVQVEARGKSYLITAKHDRENLYVLMQWNGPPGWNHKISLLFEQGDGKLDFNRNTDQIDWYYQGDSTDPSIIGDGHYESAYVSDQHIDGSLKAGYDVNKSEWVLEWKIPMNSGDKDDIYVNKYPTVLGFSIINGKYGEGGIMPPYADTNNPQTWAYLNIVDKRKL